MRSAIIGLVIGIILGAVGCMVIQDYRVTKVRVNNIEKFLNDSVSKQQSMMSKQEVKGE